jgi:hypothetical protein
MIAVDESVSLGNAWLDYMRRGQFESAWQVSDRILAGRRGQTCWHWPRHMQYVWDGSTLVGKRVLIRCYHGLGDTIQFIRYAPLVKQIAKEVVVWAQPSLLPLIEHGLSIDRVLPLHDGAPDMSYDVDVESMELPYIFRSSLTSLPATVPYLQVPPHEPNPPKRDLSAQAPVKCVGVVWRAGNWNERRSIPASLMARLSAVPGVALYLLQDSLAASEWPEQRAVRIAAEPVTELARAITSLDLLITIDSLPAHLGGALGIPTWVLLPTDPDWRWMEEREDSPWYPTMRLWRQERPDDWQAVIERVVAELHQLTSDQRPTRTR